MRNITVDPAQLESAAARIDDHNQNYVRAFTNLFEAVETMKSGWEGKDNYAFSAKISQFESDFREMNLLCTQYAEFLRSSARSYIQIQDDLTSQVNALSK